MSEAEVAPDTRPDLVGRAEAFVAGMEDSKKMYGATWVVARHHALAAAPTLVRDLLAALREAQGKLDHIRAYTNDLSDHCATELIDVPPAVKRVVAILDEGEAPE